jgi:hypothetical protein
MVLKLHPIWLYMAFVYDNLFHILNCDTLATLYPISKMQHCN